MTPDMMDLDQLVVTPDEADGFIEDLPDEVVHVYQQYGGRKVYRITVGTPGQPHILFTRPHAHEPAGTAACFEWIRRLLDGNDEWASQVLESFRLSLIPDANPSGSQRAPVKFWDGTRYENKTFFLWMFGESGDEPGERFPRLDTWDARDVTFPALLGIAYEQLDEHTYVEPNRDHRSTFFRAYFDLHAKEPVDVWLDMHQTEYVGSDRNTHINLPTNQDQLVKGLQDHHVGLGGAIHDRWRREGANPHDAPRHPYASNPVQRDFLNAVWHAITPKTLHLVTEVQNNSTRTPVETQVSLQMAAMDETLRYVREHGASLTDALADSRGRQGGP
ncbi:TPA: hypothetical protein DCE37_01180 [Candidatus Latescibacteria bacterium]|nr:hypothetical protein [Candidatus Latescibacterota bacterium]